MFQKSIVVMVVMVFPKRGHDRKRTIGLTGVTGDFTPIAGTELPDFYRTVIKEVLRVD